MSRRSCFEATLPYRWVCYPYAWLGAFPGFRETSDSPVVFCECQRQAILNRLALWPPGIRGDRMIRTGFSIPDTEDFPWDFWHPILDAGAKSNEDFTAALQFRSSLCHECNRRVPPTEANAPPSTDAFATLFRAYLRKKSFEIGVDMTEGWILEDRCIPEVKALVSYDPLVYRRTSSSWDGHWEHLSERRAKWREAAKPVAELVRHLTRNAFGFPHRGPALTSETILFLRTVEAFPNVEVKRHFRPKGLRGLSLDVFIPEFKIGIEYQGDQHFTAFDHLGGESALRRTQERDERKRRLFRKMGVEIVYFEGNVAFIGEADIRSEVNKLRKAMSER